MTAKELTLREIQLESLKILKKVDEICKNEGLRYWLAYGTLIGAVRHKGFIPWDDDVDIWMPREDYEKLLSFFEWHEEELKPLVVTRNTHARLIPYLITRISNIKFQMVGEMADDVPELGTFIDVYPLDGLGNDRAAAIKNKYQCRKLMTGYGRCGAFHVNIKSASLFKRIVKAIVYPVLNVVIDPRVFLKKQQRFLKDYEASAYVDVPTWGAQECNDILPYVFEKSFFEKTITMGFEDANLNIPSGYDEILRLIYGDYMMMPRKDKQYPHHKYRIFKRIDYL